MVYTEEVANGVIKFTWEPSFQSQKVKSVEVILAQARGVNHGSFVEGTSQKDDSTLQIHKLNPCTSGQFEKSIELPLETYQFLFRVTDEENRHKMMVSGSHLQTVLASGTTVNYVEKNTPSRIRDAFADVNESSPLLKQEQQERENPRKGGCGCGPGQCCLL